VRKHGADPYTGGNSQAFAKRAEMWQAKSKAAKRARKKNRK
jgi:hypothetical protein